MGASVTFLPFERNERSITSGITDNWKIEVGSRLPSPRSALQGQVSLKLGLQKILSNSSSHLADVDDQVGAQRLRAAPAQLIHWRRIRATTYFSRLPAFARCRARRACISPRDDCLGLAVQCVSSIARGSGSRNLVGPHAPPRPSGLIRVIKWIVRYLTFPRKVEGPKPSAGAAAPEGRGAPGCICGRRVLLTTI